MAERERGVASPSPRRTGRGLGRGVRFGPWGSPAGEFIGASSPQPSPPLGEEREKSRRVLRGNFLNSTAVWPSGHPQATLRPSGSQPVGTPKPPSGYPQATPRLP